MSKPEPTRVIYQDHKLWTRFKGLSLPQVIEWSAKGWARQEQDPIYGQGTYLVQVERHKPHHTKGRKPRFYIVPAPKRRPLLTVCGPIGWLDY